MQNKNLVDDLDGSNRIQDAERKNSAVVDNDQALVRNFDLNVGLDENGDLKDTVSAAPGSLGAESDRDVKHEEFHDWSLSEVERMAIDPVQLASLNGTVEEEEDYDEED